MSLAKAAIVTTLTLSLTAAGCGGTPVAAPTPDAVNGVIDLSPVLGTKLLHGQTVTFTGTAGYSLSSAASGQLVLLAQDQTGKGLGSTQPGAAVAQGSGQATLSLSITVPDSGVTVVQLFFVLFATGATTSHAAAPLTYQVQ